jgi:TonB family protein
VSVSRRGYSLTGADALFTYYEQILCDCSTASPRHPQSLVTEFSLFTRKHQEERGEQGVATFYSVVGKNGKIIKLFMIQSAGTDLDKSSAAAVSQWKYDQPMCDGVLAPVETTIDVIFTLQQ